MTLAFVQALVAIILTLVATWTGLLVSVAFLLPGSASKSEHLIATEPWKCFGRGIGMLLLIVLGLIVSSVGHPVVKALGLGILMFVGTFIAIGAAGIAQTIGKRGEPDETAPTFGMLVRGSLVFSLALGFPVVGWLVFAPLALVIAAGAGVMALVPSRRTAFTPPNVPPGSNDYDLSGRTSAIS